MCHPTWWPTSRRTRWCSTATLHQGDRRDKHQPSGNSQQPLQKKGAPGSNCLAAIPEP
jgi:hypothetical protein